MYRNCNLFVFLHSKPVLETRCKPLHVLSRRLTHIPASGAVY